MTIFDDEVISLAAVDAAKTLTRSKIDRESTGSTKASRAVLTAHTAPVAYRYGNPPVPGTNEYHLLAAGESVTIDGYDNLLNLQVILASGATTAKLFASYGA